jgi:FkbM family methyltransferase
MKGPERIRDLARRALSKNLYVFSSRILDTLWTIATQGFPVYRTLKASSGGPRQLSTVTLKRYSHPIRFRPETTDVDVIVQNLIRQEYGKIPSRIAPKLIIDAGGNIGDTAVYFLNRFKDCRVVTLEPHPDFFAIAEQNLAPYRNAILLKRGLWSHEAKLSLSDDSLGSSVYDESGCAFEIDCVGVGALLQEYGCERLDILKMDIEGAESQVILENSDKWLPMTELVIAELHGPEIKRDCIAFMEKAGFSWYQYRSLHYFLNDSIRRV